MKSNKLWYLVTLIAFALLPLAGCSGGGTGVITEKGTELKVGGQIETASVAKSTAKALFSTAATIGTVSAIDAASATVLGTASIQADGTFSGLSFTLAATKSTVVFKADLTAGSPLRAIIPIDLTSPPAGLSNNNVTITIDQASTAIAAQVSVDLGLASGQLVGDVALPSTATFIAVAQSVANRGGVVLSYSSNGITLTGSVGQGLLPALNIASLDANGLSALNLVGKVTQVAVPDTGKPVISFQVTNAATGKGVTGIPVANMRFGLIKLQPATNGGADTWISYMQSSASKTASTESTGTLADNGDGSYTYTFATNVKAALAPTSGFNTGLNVAYDASLTHRLGIIFSGSIAGTTNPATGAAFTITNPLNVIYDFIPATPTTTPSTNRIVVSTDRCLECHQKWQGNTAAFHGGNRYDTKLCVVCHNSQRGNGATDGTADTNGNIALQNGVATGDLAPFIHRLHRGKELVNPMQWGNINFNEVGYPQDMRNCTKCHDESNPNIKQATNWKTRPSRAACGSCHDAINWSTGAGHSGGARTDDSLCAGCHSATAISTYHIPVTPPQGTTGNTNVAYMAGFTKNLPAGASVITYDLKSVSRNSSKQPVIVFKLKQDGTDVNFGTYNATTNPELIPNFAGSPTVYFAFAVPQDGITKPADFNATASGYIKTIWNGTATGTGAGSISGPDSSGYYTITLTGVTIPDTAVMLTGGLGYAYSFPNSQPLTQTNVSGYAYNSSTKLGGLIVQAPNVWKVASGGAVDSTGAYSATTAYAGRRAIVENARCYKCHEQLGVFPFFHAGQRNDAQTCSFCHNPNRTSSGWSANAKDFIHGIHAAGFRTSNFTWHSPSLTDGYWNVTYPGVLKNCEACHLPGTYNFGASAYGSAVPNLLWSTAAANGSWVTNTTTKIPPANTSYYSYGAISTNSDGTVGLFGSSTTALSAWVLSGTDYGPAFAYNASAADSTAGKQLTFQAAATTLVTSPITAACFSCHDSSSAKAHMTANGGVIYQPRGSYAISSNPEQCLWCHGPGKAADIMLVHK